MAGWLCRNGSTYPDGFQVEVLRGRAYTVCPLCARRFCKPRLDHLDTPECMQGSVYRIMQMRRWDTLGAAHHVLRKAGVPIEHHWYRNWAPEWAVLVGSCTDVAPARRFCWLQKLLRDIPCPPDELWAEMDTILRLTPHPWRPVLTDYLHHRLG